MRFLNDPVVIFSSVKKFQVFLSNTNNYTNYQSFIFSQLTALKYCDVTVTLFKSVI